MPITKTRRGLGAVAGACLLLSLALAGCGSSRDQAAGAPGAGTQAPASVAMTAPTGATSKPGGAAVAATPSTSQKLPKGASTAQPKDPIAPTSITPVKRNGKASYPRVKVKGGPKSFTQSITYTDGLSLQITRMKQGKVTGQGPGVFPGRALTDFYVTLTNGTQQTMSLGVVVVTVTYGSPARVAHLVYDQNSIDFAGSIKPGAAGHAVYGFSVPAASRGDVTMTVDLDGVHQLAVFSGRVQ